MNLDEVLHHRRSVRVYDKEKPIDTEKVKHCLELATLAPNSSRNMRDSYSILNGRTFVITVLKNVRTNVLRIGKYITVY